ncbi:CBS domain containing protein [Methanococcus vannielii SB]|uniref:CBS domain containing protein n=1 Tax=Methanococcus vannielii (strain ATCC 35089 / DSM 1224 / JCM 13029 / OCM 148 / SB) TaxID=406327 RepID=A6UPQ1_METVS|nr:CBS domain-containing protein [Methanococcus vannielii]ABR54473.1 CBS domain containing protein [Methanococcus vannielii SB]
MKIKALISEKKVEKVYPTTKIIEALEMMNKNHVRRIPVVAPGTGRVEGILTNMDIVNLMGGGSKYNLVKFKHEYNMISAINESVKEIMTDNVVFVRENAELEEVIDLFVSKKIGGVPVVDKSGILISTINERDVIKYLEDSIYKNILVRDCMTEKVVCATPGERLKDVARTMLRNGFRRLPVVFEEKLVGIITSTDFISLLGSDWAFNNMKTGNIREITNLRIQEIMKKDVLSISPDMKLFDAVKVMSEKDIGVLPVVEGEMLIGILTEKDVVSCIFKK